MKRVLLTAVFVCCLHSIKAQVLEWDLGFYGFVDNREYATSDRESATFLGTQLAPEIGLWVDSTHRIRFGINLLHEFGTEQFSSKISPTIYYNYHQKDIDFYIGAFPRAKLTDKFPRSLLSDTLMYFRPNHTGMLFKIEKQRLYQNIWIDWISKQTTIQREQFLVGASGHIKFGRFFISHDALLWHNALPDNPIEDIHLRDNAAATAQFGVDLSTYSKLDSLTIGIGGILSADRLRGVYEWKGAKGGLIEAYVGYNSFFFHNTLYFGEEQALALGDNFYSEKFYNRLDLGWAPFRGQRFSAKLVASFHFTKDGVDNQQALILRYNIGSGHLLKNTRFK